MTAPAAPGREPSVDQLADELFRLVERDQGCAFISDGLAGAGMTRHQFFKAVEQSLHFNKEASRKMARFLAKYKHLRRRP